MHRADENEQLLLQRCLAGSTAAWQDFIERHSSLVYYAIRSVLSTCSQDLPPEQIADLHNDVFLAIMDRQGRKLRQYEGKNGCSLSTWVRVIAVRRTIDFLRRQRDMVSLSDEGPPRVAERRAGAEPDAEDRLIAQERQQQLVAVLHELPARDQLFIKLFYYECRSPQEIARLLNISPSAVYSRGNYLREKLKKLLHKKKIKD